MKNEQARLYIGRRIADLRKEVRWIDRFGSQRVGMTQEELAEQAGLQTANIARIEQGRYAATADVLTSISEALGKRLDIV